MYAARLSFKRWICLGLRLIAVGGFFVGIARGGVEWTASPTSLGQLFEMSEKSSLELFGVDLIDEYLLCMEGLPAETNTETTKEGNARNKFKEWKEELRLNPPRGDEHQKAQGLVDFLRRNMQKEPLPLPIQTAYVALGRKLGYPLKLASQNGEPCVFWMDRKTKFKIGDFRRSETFWQTSDKPPMIWLSFSPKDGAEKKEWILGPQDELSIFVGMRAMKLEAAGYNDEALVAFAQAHQLSPSCLDHLNGILRVAKKVTPLVGHASSSPLPERVKSPMDDPEWVFQLNNLNMEISCLRIEKNRLIYEQSNKRNSRP